MSKKAEKVIDSLASRILDLENNENDCATRQFVDKMANGNTQLQTQSHMRLFSKWLNAKSEMRAPEHIEPKQLDIYIAQFFLTIRKEGNGDINHPSRQYEPSTITAMHSSMFRYLNFSDYGHNIKTSELFRHSRDVMTSKMKELKQLGKGSKPNAAQPFTTDHIAMLYEQNILGTGQLVFLCLSCAIIHIIMISYSLRIVILYLSLMALNMVIVTNYVTIYFYGHRFSASPNPTIPSNNAAVMALPLG